ncbi:MAG: GTP-binding protein [Burkholderiaceae bacterium]
MAHDIQDRGLLRFATAGSVDDGKSTLIGRLLIDSKSLLGDHLSAIEAASRKRGLSQVDLSLLTDGLIAEREQGITIDVAYRYFATAARKFIIADSPGHAQYTRNMVTAASTADVAVLLVDARKGLQSQTRRHAYLSSWVGIRRIVLAVNKIDLVGYSPQRFDEIDAEFRDFVAGLDFAQVQSIPMSALNGDMVVERGDALGWYRGPTLLEYLETVPAHQDDDEQRPFRFAVQRVVRVPLGQAQPGSAYRDREFRGYQGTIASGRIAVGDTVAALPSGLSARVAELLVADRPVDAAFADEAVTIALDQDIDVSRGDWFVAPDRRPRPQRAVDAEICWFDAEPLEPDRPYRIKHATQSVLASFAPPAHRVDVESLARVADPGTLAMNDIGRVRLNAQKPLPFEPYRDNRLTGSFIVIDEASNRTVAAGTVV